MMTTAEHATEVFPAQDGSSDWSWHCFTCETGQDYLPSEDEAYRVATDHQHSV